MGFFIGVIMNLSIFSFSNQDVRTLESKDELWLVATDVAEILGYRDAADMVRMLDDDEKGTHIVRTLSAAGDNRGGGEQALTTVNESGLYHAIFNSRREEAKEFRKWVTSVVLPTIRKTGEYKHVEYLASLPQSLESVETQVKTLTDQLDALTAGVRKARKMQAPVQTRQQVDAQLVREALMHALREGPKPLSLLKEELGVTAYRVLDAAHELGLKHTPSSSPFDPDFTL